MSRYPFSDRHFFTPPTRACCIDPTNQRLGNLPVPSDGTFAVPCRYERVLQGPTTGRGRGRRRVTYGRKERLDAAIRASGRNRNEPERAVAATNEREQA